MKLAWIDQRDLEKIKKDHHENPHFYEHVAAPNHSAQVLLFELVLYSSLLCESLAIHNVRQHSENAPETLF